MFKFTGTEIALWHDVKNIDCLVSVDGGDFTTLRLGGHAPTIIAQNLTSGEHTIKIKMASGGSAFKIGSLFTRDAKLATTK